MSTKITQTTQTTISANQYRHRADSSKNTKEQPAFSGKTAQVDTFERQYEKRKILFEETHKLNAKELKEGKDWRDLSEEEWDEMLESVDIYIDAFKENIRKMVELQKKAMQKAAMQASPDRRAAAISQAALAVAANGLGAEPASDSGDETDADTDGQDSEVSHEKNWTRRLKTDDQTILRSAKEAQDMERRANRRMEEIISDGEMAYQADGDMMNRYRRKWPNEDEKEQTYGTYDSCQWDDGIL